MKKETKLFIAIICMGLSIMIMAIGLGFEICWLGYVAFSISLLSSGFAISNTISRFEIRNKSRHLILTLILGGICIMLDTIPTVIIGVILVCLSSGLLIDRLLPTKNN